MQQDAASLESKKYKISELRQEVEILKTKLCNADQEVGQLREKLRMMESNLPAENGHDSSVRRNSGGGSLKDKSRKHLFSFSNLANPGDFFSSSSKEENPEVSPPSSSFAFPIKKWQMPKKGLVKDGMVTLSVLTTYDSAHKHTLRIDSNITIREIKVILQVKL